MDRGAARDALEREGAGQREKATPVPEKETAVHIATALRDDVWRLPKHAKRKKATLFVSSNGMGTQYVTSYAHCATDA